MSRKKRRDKEDDSNKPIAVRAAGLAEWLEDIDDSAAIVRWFRLWWNKGRILEVAFEALDALADLEKKDGPHDKVRRALNIAAVALGHAPLAWKGAKDT